MSLSKFSKIKKGELFKFEGKRKVYIFEGGGKVRGFKYSDFNDTSNFFTTKVDRKIQIGFYF